MTRPGRSVPEWVGKTPDHRVPPSVRLRIFEAHDGICHISGRKTEAGETWDLEHRVALADGGEHREGNLAPALRDVHREKTSQEATERAVSRRKRMKHLGIDKPRRSKVPGSKGTGLRKRMDGTVIFVKEEREG